MKKQTIINVCFGIIILGGLFYLSRMNTDATSSKVGGETVTVTTREGIDPVITTLADAVQVDISGTFQKKGAGKSMEDFQFKSNYPAPMSVTITPGVGDYDKVGFGCDPHFLDHYVSTNFTGYGITSSVSSPASFTCGQGHIQVFCDGSKSACSGTYSIQIKFFRDSKNRPRSIHMNQHSNG